MSATLESIVLANTSIPEGGAGAAFAARPMSESGQKEADILTLQNDVRSTPDNGHGIAPADAALYAVGWLLIDFRQAEAR